MDNTALDLGLGIYGAYRICKACRSVDGDNENIFGTAITNLVKDADPVLGALVSADLQAKDFTMSVRSCPNSNINGFLDGSALLPHISILP